MCVSSAPVRRSLPNARTARSSTSLAAREQTISTLPLSTLGVAVYGVDSRRDSTQMCRQLFLQHAAGLNEEAAIDRFVRYLPIRVGRELLLSHPEICSRDNCSACFRDTRHRSSPCSAKRQGLGRDARSKALLSARFARYPDDRRCGVAPGLQSMAIVSDRAQSPASTGRPQCPGKSLRAPQALTLPTSPARRLRDPSWTPHPINAGLVPPVQRPAISAALCPFLRAPITQPSAPP